MDCLYDSGNCIKEKKCPLEEQCKKAYGDGVCHPLCNNAECGYDVDCIKEPNLVSEKYYSGFFTMVSTKIPF